jgi:hypothetical protein
MAKWHLTSAAGGLSGALHMHRSPPMPPLRPKTLTHEKSDFTSEGAPPPEPAGTGTNVEATESSDDMSKPRTNPPLAP